MTHLQVGRFLAPPTFEEEEKTRLAGLQNIIYLGAILLSVLFGFGVLILNPEPLRLIFAGTWILLGLSGYFLMRRGQVELSGILFSSIAWILLTWATVVSGGVNTPGIASYTTCILIAGLLLGSRGGLVFAGLSIVAGSAILYAEINNVLPPPLINTTPISMWAGLTLNFMAVAVLLHLATHSVSDALTRARSDEAALLASNRELQATQASLEIRTSELSTAVELLESELGERRRISEALKQSEENFKALADNANDGITIIGEGETVVYVNQRGAGISGHTAVELLNTTIKELVHPDEYERISTIFGQRLSGGPAPSQYETKIVHKDGHTVPVEITGARTVWQGQPVGLAVVRDITERKRTEEKLLKLNTELELGVKERTKELANANEELKREIVERERAEIALTETFIQVELAKREWEVTADSLPQVICLFDRQGIIRRANRTVEEWELAQVTEVKGIRLHELFHPGCSDPNCYLKNFWIQASEEVVQGRSAECEAEDVGLGRCLYFQIRPILTQPTGRVTPADTFGVVVVQDVTERKRAEEALRESEARLALAIVGTDGALWDAELDPEATFEELPDAVYLSPQEKQLLGYDEDEELPHSQAAWDSHVLPEDIPQREKNQRDHFAGRTEFLDHEYRVRRKDGQIRWIHGRSRIIRDEQGRPIRWIGIDWDVTRRKQAETALRESEQRFRDIVENAQAGYFLIDTDGHYREVNQTWLQMHGYDSAEEIIGQHFSITLVDGDPRETLAVGEKVLGGESGPTGTFARRCKDGSIKYQSYSITPAIKNGQVIGLEGFLTDITERMQLAEELARHRDQLEEMVAKRTAELKETNDLLTREIAERQQADAELRQAEKRYRALFEEAPAMYVITRNQEGIPMIADCNESFLSTLNYDRVEVLGRPLVDFYSPASHTELLDSSGYSRALEGHYGVEERQLVAGDGRVVETLLRARPEIDSEGQVSGTRAMFLDITERKQAERALQVSEERFRQVITSISDHIYVTELTEAGEHMNIYLSPHVETMSGYPLAKFEADWSFWPYTVIHPDDRATAAEHLAKLEKGLPGEVEYRLVRVDGDIVWVRDSARVENRGKSKIFYGLISDITERKQAEAEIRMLNEQLEQRVVDRTRELSTLYEVTAVASEALDLPAILERSLEQVLVAVRSKVGLIYLATEKDEQLRMAVQQGISPGEIAQVKALLTDNRLLSWVIENNKPVLIPDLTTDSRIGQEVAPASLQTYVGVPIRAGGQLLGVLNIFGKFKKQFNVEDVALLGSVADQIGVAVENTRLRQQAEQMAVLEERERLARELHDSVTQSLYSLTLFAEASSEIIKTGEIAPIEHNLERIGETAQQALKEMRMLVFELRPLDLERLGLVGALHQRLSAVEKRAGVDARLVAEELVELPAALEQELYRIVQEALNNVLKHSMADFVTVYLRVINDQVELEIIDNGQGFDPDGVRDKGGLGLFTMQERAEKLGGSLSIQSEPEKGTIVHVTVRPG